MVGTSLASALWYWLVQRDDLGRLAMYLFLVPVLGLTIAALAFGERIGLLESTGVALTIAGIGAAVLESRSATATNAATGTIPIAFASSGNGASALRGKAVDD